VETAGQDDRRSGYAGGREKCRRPATGVNHWLVSFGDLLTLLLCFFITILSFGGMKPEGSTDKLGINGGTQVDAAFSRESNDGGNPAGIELAVLSDREADYKEVTLNFEESDFSQSGEVLTEAALAGLKRQVTQDGYTPDRALLQTCADREAGSAEYEWYLSLGRALFLRSQLIDAGISPQALRLRVAGARCEVLRRKQEGPSIASLVTIRMRRNTNG